MAGTTKVKVKRSTSAKLPGASPQTGLGQVQLGQSGLKRSYGYIYEELLPQLQGRKAINVYQEMSQNSPIIGGMLFAIDTFVRKVAWHVEAASDSDVDKQKAKFVESCKDDMEHTWSEFISEINTMLPYGWSWFEIVYKQRFNDVIDEFGTTTSKFNDGMIGWKKFMPIAQESWWRWDFDPESGKTIGMWQRPAPDYSERYLPIGKSLHFRTTSRKDNPEGASILRTAYRPWYFLKRIEEIEAIGVERDLAGIPFATVPAEMLSDTASDAHKQMVQAIIKLVQNVRRDEQEGIVWPQAYDANGNELYTFKLLTSGGTRQFPTQEIITRYEQRIALTALADFLLLGNDSSNGSYALATSKSSMFQAALETWLNIIEDVINDRAIPLLFRQNGINSGPYPKMRHDIVQKPTLPDLATLISAMAGAGAQLFPDTDLENHIREYAELPIRESNDTNRATEEDILVQQLKTILAESESQQQIAERTGKDAKAEGVVPIGQGSIKPGAFVAAGGAAAGASPAGAAGTSPTGTGGKQPGSKKGAPTKSTGPVKSTSIPKQRRSTISTRAAQGAPTKSTGGKKTTSVAKHLSDIHAPKRNLVHQLSKDFPMKAMQWLDHAVVEGPVAVPIADINTKDRAEWAATHEPEKVAAIRARMAVGKMKPILVTQAVKGGKKNIVDGHHRFTAAEQLGHTHVLAYVAHVPRKKGPWAEMHASQFVNPNLSSTGYEPHDPKVFQRLGKSYDPDKKLKVRLVKTQDIVMQPVKSSNTMDMGSYNPNKRCDYCRNTATQNFVQKSTGGIVGRVCQIHIPQAKAELRWSQNNQVSPVNPSPYAPFPRVLTQ